MGHKFLINAFDDNTGDERYLVISLTVSNAKYLELDCKGTELSINRKQSCNPHKTYTTNLCWTTFEFNNDGNLTKYYTRQENCEKKNANRQIWMKLTEKCESVSGKICVKFIPLDGYNLKEMLQVDFLKSGLREAEEDFTIICQNQIFKFSKHYLAMISPVFKNMMKSTYVESENDTTKIEDIEPEIVQTFKNILYHDCISEEDITPQLMLFAKRYLIEPLIKICRYKLLKNLTKENFVDVIQAAYWNEDEELLKCGVEFVVQNLGTFENNPEYERFLKAHPDFSVKIMKMMMYKK